MPNFTLKVVFKDDGMYMYDLVIDLFKYESYTKSYWRGFVPPNHVEYIIGPLTQTGVKNWKEKLVEYNPISITVTENPK